MVPKLPAAHSARKLPNFHQLGELWASIHRKDCRKIDSPLARRFEFSKIGRSDTRENLCSPFCARRNHKYERRKERARARFSISRRKFSAHLPIMYPLCSNTQAILCCRPPKALYHPLCSSSFIPTLCGRPSLCFFLPTSRRSYLYGSMKYSCSLARCIGKGGQDFYGYRRNIRG